MAIEIKLTLTCDHAGCSTVGFAHVDRAACRPDVEVFAAVRKIEWGMDTRDGLVFCEEHKRK